MNNVTIKEEFTLPSLGKIYDVLFDPVIKLRSMTVAEEMKRLTATDSPYKAMSEIIEACLETKLPISVYDLCIGDYQFLLHKLRVVTYGPEYSLTMACPYCGSVFDDIINLDELEVHEYDESFNELLQLKLPVSGKVLELHPQTPRDLDTIERLKKQMRKKDEDISDPTLLLNLESVIKTIDGQPVTHTMVQQFLTKLPLRDSTLIMQRAEKINRKVGIDINIKTQCKDCGNDVNSTFRYTNEFFRPRIDE